jgi:hypothetical protein
MASSLNCQSGIGRESNDSPELLANREDAAAHAGQRGVNEANLHFAIIRRPGDRTRWLREIF